ncbi:SAVED domain-containing protein [Parabacteroides sp. GYB001]|uniref:SAVED domain-containing protein n=1 Tax=Parabacteroides leei TaxID=2939491 RepID=UPI002017D3C5|nr:SAVED domain-containing protein [Parabacteroides leei]MCL3854168.1 SAVED domain-containing protein [Parabacteroides leei]
MANNPKLKSPIKEITASARKKLKDAAYSRLWAKSAGRCEFQGCNCLLYEDNITGENNSHGQKAHIVAFSENGPRGDKELSAALDGDDENLMLLCNEHHHLIDHEGVEKYSVDVLRKMKENREREIRQLTELTTESKSTCLVYMSSIGKFNPTIDDSEIRNALWSSSRKFLANGLSLRIQGSVGIPDWDEDYWKAADKALCYQIAKFIASDPNHRDHYSIFALAPQPLLVKLGLLINSLSRCDIYQRNREKESWVWPDNDKDMGLAVSLPNESEAQNSKAVLIIAISADAIIESVHKQLEKEQCAYWQINADKPNYDWASSRKHLDFFRYKVEEVLNDIRKRSKNDELHVFIAAPASCNIVLGRAWMPKVDIPLSLYNLNPEKKEYQKVLTINVND